MFRPIVAFVAISVLIAAGCTGSDDEAEPPATTAPFVITTDSTVAPVLVTPPEGKTPDDVDYMTYVQQLNDDVDDTMRLLQPDAFTDPLPVQFYYGQSPCRLRAGVSETTEVCLRDDFTIMYGAEFGSRNHSAAERRQLALVRLIEVRLLFFAAAVSSEAGTPPDATCLAGLVSSKLHDSGYKDAIISQNTLAALRPTYSYASYARGTHAASPSDCT